MKTRSSFPSSFQLIAAATLLVLLIAGFVSVAIPAQAAIDHHNNVSVSYTCGTYTVTADYIGGSGNRVVTVKEDSDGGGPLGYVEVARYTFYGVNHWAFTPSRAVCQSISKSRCRCTLTTTKMDSPTVGR